MSRNDWACFVPCSPAPICVFHEKASPFADLGRLGQATSWLHGLPAGRRRVRTFRSSRDQCLSELVEPCAETTWRARGEFLRGGTNSSNPSPSSEESAANSVQTPPAWRLPGQVEDASGQQHPVEPSGAARSLQSSIPAPRKPLARGPAHWQARPGPDAVGRVTSLTRHFPDLHGRSGRGPKA